MVMAVAAHCSPVSSTHSNQSPHTQKVETCFLTRRFRQQQQQQQNNKTKKVILLLGFYSLSLLNYTIPCSCRPYSLDSLGDTHVGGLELIEGQADDDGGGVQTPGEDLAGARRALLRDVV